MATHRAVHLNAAGRAGDHRCDVRPAADHPGDLLFGNFSVIGHPSDTSADIEDTMHFAVQSGVRARIEEMALAVRVTAWS
jgi:hypothetical protein